MILTAKKEKSLIIEILIKLGLSEEDAGIVAEATLDADLKGFTSHGIGRFPQYIHGIEEGNIKTEGDITIEKETEAMALINGNSLFGQLVAHKAMMLAIEKAKKMGIAAVGTHNSHHFGVTGYYSDLAIRNEVIGVVTANTEPAVAPLGANKPLIGTNPIAVGIPADETYIAVDMATSASARGKLLEAQRKGEKIPEGVALDSEGKPTIDPEEALKGSILPFGAHKGYALAFMIELMTGPLVNASCGTDVKGTANHTEKCTKGDLFIAIDPSKFVDMDQFKDNTEDFIKQVRASGDTFVPGDLEVKNIAENEKNGFKVDEKLYDNLKSIGDNLDIDFSKYISE
ncbi:Malate/(S)-sulfolactate dehydrogenase [Candidatus Methanobinarius endosymbioticus]|uniref:Malate/(S)-sulfolactate dehydrogenase n=1 Tax=Candidatus Methanobinarius endosymbioticus TaxID=2006182 RepID=A0A366M9P0_9EURY|nr:Malate/(S)-sulfolactate dehydrogenase [Candidatus Methanobinarius endosymbioticus]